MTALLSRVAACAAAAALLAGCRKPPPPPIVEAGGVVLIDGKPLKKALVRFIPTIEYGAEYYATGVTNDDGRYTLTCHGQPGACVGENIVVVQEAELPADLKGEKGRLEVQKYFQALGDRPLPAKYASFAENPLSVNVTPSRKEYNLYLAR